MPDRYIKPIESIWIYRPEDKHIIEEIFKPYGQTVEGKREVVGSVANEDNGETSTEGTDQR